MAATTLQAKINGETWLQEPRKPTEANERPPPTHRAGKERTAATPDFETLTKKWIARRRTEARAAAGVS